MGERAVKAPHSTASSVEGALLELLGRQAQRVPLSVFIAAICIGAISFEVMGTLVVSLWLSLVLLVLVVRYSVLGHIAKQTNKPTAVRLKTAVLLSALNGSVHAVSLIFFVFLPDFERAMITLVLLGLSTGAVVTTAGYRPVFLAYLTPTLVPLILLWLVNWAEGFAWREGFFALLLLLFGATLLVLARDTFRLFRESFEIRLEQIGLNQKLRQALTDSENANLAKTRFLAAASHDLRQPIHSLNLFIGALSRRPLDAKTQEIADHLVLAVNTFDAQLDALLDVSKLDAGVVEVNLEAVCLRDLTNRLKKQFGQLASEKNLSLWVECPAGAHAYTDQSHLERLLGNLVSNAIKYTDRGEVRVSVCQSGEQHLISISDSGRGIPAGEQERVFEEFYQLENPNRDRSKGLGLGLAIVRRLAGLLELELSLESELGMGTEFTLAVPCASEPPAAVSQQPPNFALEGVSVLAVDDEMEVIISLKFSLESQGCLVYTAQDTVTAVGLAKEHRPDILICDFRLAGDDNGLDTVSAIRKLYPGLPAILITGDTAPDRLREAAAADLRLMHKPVSDIELSLAISEACQRRESNHA